MASMLWRLLTGTGTTDQLGSQTDFHNCHISILPEDVLLSIFKLCADEDTSTTFKLCHVCSHWRTLCSTSSDLWSNIKVINDFATYSRSTGEFQHLRAYLHYSRNRLLDLVVRIRMDRSKAKHDECYHYKGENDAYHRRTRIMARIIARHTHRVRSLKIKMDTYNGAKIFLKALTDPLPQLGSAPVVLIRESPIDELNRKWGHLETLEVQWTGSVRAFGNVSRTLRNESMVSFLNGATTIYGPIYAPTPPLPRLRSLEIRGIAVNWDRFGPTHLEELLLVDLQYQIQPTYDQLRAILIRNSRTLQTLSLIDVCQYFEAEPWEELDTLVFDLPFLHSLKLGYVNPIDILPFVTYSRFSSLTNLAITNLGGKQYQNATLGVVPAENEMNYFTRTHAVLSTMVDSWDLNTVDFITLVDVQLFFDNVETPPNPMDHLEGLWGDDTTGDPNIWMCGMPGWSYDARMLMPFTFWLQFGSVRRMRLVGSDPFMLYALYCPVPVTSSIQGREIAEKDLPGGMGLRTPTTGKLLSVPIPTLDEFWLEGIPDEAVKEFVARRSVMWNRYCDEREMRARDLTDYNYQMIL